MPAPHCIWSRASRAEGFAAALAERRQHRAGRAGDVCAACSITCGAPGAPLVAPRARFLYAGGAPLDPQLKADVERPSTQPLHNGYGLTETSPDRRPRPGSMRPRADLSIGPPVPGIEARIVDAAGSALPPGEVGELHIRGPNVMLGYYRAPELTAAVVDAPTAGSTPAISRAPTPTATSSSPAAPRS